MLNRRRFLVISAAMAGTSLAGGAARASTTYRWRGIALGARAEVIIHHPDRKRAEDIVRRSIDEVRRLEAVFSLYRRDSALSRLNRDGHLRRPPHELVALLARARTFGDLTGGAFDVTVQPLWVLYARHFSAPDADPAGPPASELEAARRFVDYRKLRVDGGEVSLPRAGAALTLNGIAQGYITDRVTALMKAQGIVDVLVDIGEIRGSGRRPDGAPWRIGIAGPPGAGPAARRVSLADAAVSTSGGYGFAFDAAGRHSHLIHPRTGCSPRRWASVTVVAGEATTADALSTAFALMDEKDIAGTAALAGVDRYFLRPGDA